MYSKNLSLLYIAASQKIFQEYLFNKKGELIFYYRRINNLNEKGKNYQERYYLKYGALIRVMVNGPQPRVSGQEAKLYYE